jgi:excisionase family DNA binding protein
VSSIAGWAVATSGQIAMGDDARLWTDERGPVTNEPLSVPVEMRPACGWLIRVGRFQWSSARSKLAFELSGASTTGTRSHESDQESDRATVDQGVRMAGAPHGRLLLTFDEAVEMFGIGGTSLYRLVWAGRLTPVRIGRSVRFSCARLEVFVSSTKSGAC